MNAMHALPVAESINAVRIFNRESLFIGSAIALAKNVLFFCFFFFFFWGGGGLFVCLRPGHFKLKELSQKLRKGIIRMQIERASALYNSWR